MKKFIYQGEYRGRIKWGEIEAPSFEKALKQLEANGLKKVRVLEPVKSSNDRELAHVCKLHL